MVFISTGSGSGTVTSVGLSTNAPWLTVSGSPITGGGTITLNVSISPTGKSFIVDAKVSAKIPEHDRPSTTFFMTPEGTLMRNDPNQPRLPLREVVDKQTGELRTVRS